MALFTADSAVVENFSTNDSISDKGLITNENCSETLTLAICWRPSSSFCWKFTLSVTLLNFQEKGQCEMRQLNGWLNEQCFHEIISQCYCQIRVIEASVRTWRNLISDIGLEVSSDNVGGLAGVVQDET